MTHEEYHADSDPAHAKLDVENEASPVVEIAAEDIRIWKAGAEAFWKFVHSLPRAMQESWKGNSDLQAMFLGEKPATLKDARAVQRLAQYLTVWISGTWGMRLQPGSNYTGDSGLS